MVLIDEPMSGAYSKVALIPGICLFCDLKTLEPENTTLFFMAEDMGLCRSFVYHKHKLILMLSAMRSYRDWLSENFDLVYYDISENKNQSYGKKLFNTMEIHNIDSIITYEFESQGLKCMIGNICRK